MKKFTTWAFVSAVALTLTGCGGGEEVAEEPAAPAPQAQAPAPAPAPAAQPFNQPTVPQSAPGSAALIQSTNVSERVRQVSSGRQDPFAVVQVSPVIERPQPAAGAGGQVASRPANASAGGSGTAGAGGTAGRPAGAAAGGTASRPGAAGGTKPGGSARPGGAGGTAAGGAAGARPATPAKPQPPAIAALPPLPQPTLAQAVEITGVLEAAGASQAIVRTPDAPSGRYVSVGQRLMDGQVLVKRIEMRGSEPVVVLEQDGVEVAKRVGESATPSTQQAAAPGRIAG
ncbi:hypothetical protein [Geitlerinema sp. PCC 7407]|uniref:hypothetical protein n=1 Tax=Geitlerinema sp. PCC 7407 TaxID=1173025 RepID=UPI00029FB6D8|nr:hypothetical protein [Geitlerinema sp. PCC 7407]AFY67852.1 hypothetical protein GEI7407_3385 [Geitlerinema sp. PCC 7407]